MLNESISFGFYHEIRIDIMTNGSDWWPIFEPHTSYVDGDGEVQPLRVTDDKLHRTMEHAQQKATEFAQRHLPGPLLDRIEWRSTEVPES